MAEWVNALAIKNLADGRMKELNLTGHSVLVARVDESFYAADNTCPHRGGNLSQGSLAGTIVTCPRHGSRFDLKDGHILRWTTWTGITKMVGNLLNSPKPLPVYRTRVQDGQLQVEI